MQLLVPSHQAHSYLRAFVLAVPLAWNAPHFLHSSFLLLSKAILHQPIKILIAATQILSPFLIFLLSSYC